MIAKTTDRTIHTKLYSKTASEILHSVEGQLSDGMWENSPAMEKYWLFSHIETAPNGEILISVSRDHGDVKWSKRYIRNGFYDMTDSEVLHWFAGKIKAVMRQELKDTNAAALWNRNEDVFCTQYLSSKEKVTVSDVYFVYDTLLGRDTARKYTVKQHMQIEGMPKSEAETKAEETRRAKIDEMRAAQAAEYKTTEDWKKQEIAKIEAEYRKMRDAISARYSKAYAAIDAA